jgi:hypothetical protein
VAKRLSFIAVDGSDHAKPHGKAFEHLDWVRDASDPGKRIVPGYWSVQIDALNEQHGMLPLVSQVFSTKAPEYKSWYDTFLRPMLKVIARLGREHTWLFDRGFDAFDFLRSLMALRMGVALKLALGGPPDARLGWREREVHGGVPAIGQGEGAEPQNVLPSVDLPA